MNTLANKLEDELVEVQSICREVVINNQLNNLSLSCKKCELIESQYYDNLSREFGL